MWVSPCSRAAPAPETSSSRGQTLVLLDVTVGVLFCASERNSLITRQSTQNYVFLLPWCPFAFLSALSLWQTSWAKPQSGMNPPLRSPTHPAVRDPRDLDVAEEGPHRSNRLAVTFALTPPTTLPGWPSVPLVFSLSTPAISSNRDRDPLHLHLHTLSSTSVTVVTSPVLRTRAAATGHVCPHRPAPTPRGPAWTDPAFPACAC